MIVDKFRQLNNSAGNIPLILRNLFQHADYYWQWVTASRRPKTRRSLTDTAS